MLEGLGASVGQAIRSAGGGSRSRVWSQIRANVLGRTILDAERVGADFGAAILAASGCLYPGLVEAAQGMARTVQIAEVQPHTRPAYEEGFQRFAEICRQRGYI